jgi:esterase/lipase superfamily enzyme
MRGAPAPVRVLARLLAAADGLQGHGAMVTFQWPTGTYFWNYLTDCPRAERYVPDIERLIALLAQSSAENITVVAYSCGSPLLGAALARLRSRHPEADRLAPQPQLARPAGH